MAKVLLVEDDNNLREIYEARLMAEGYDIAAARDGEEALVIAKQVNPDLVISDVMMPKISGFEMLDILRNTEGMQHVKVIMLTALGQSEDQTRADSLGADRYLVKSQVTLEDIVNAAHDLLVDAGAIAAPETTAAQPAPAPQPVAETPALVPAPAPMPQPEPVIPTPVPAQVINPAAVAAAPSVIPVAAPPLDVSQASDNNQISMPPTDVSSIPTEALSGMNTAPTPPATEQVMPVPAPPQPEAVVPAPPTDEQAPQAQTQQQEAAVIDAQINDFINTQSGQPQPEVQPAPAPAQIVPETTAPQTTTPEQEQALADALQNLGGGAPTTEAQQPVIQPTSEEEPSRKKIIEPISDSTSAPKKSLDQLLAEEEAVSNAAQAPAVTQPAPVPPVAIAPASPQPMPAPTPSTPVAPAPPALTPQPAPAPAAPAPQAPQAAPKPANNDFDPNSIAL